MAVSADQRLATHQDVTRILAETDTLGAAVPRLLATICQGLDWDMGVFWSNHSQDKLLRCLDVWHRPGLDVSRFEARSRELALARGIGLPGRVWAEGQPVWTPDVLAEAYFTRQLPVPRQPFHGAAAVPVLLGTEVLGVVEFFSQAVRPADAGVLDLLAALGSQVGQFIKRRQAEQQLRDSEERYRLIAENVSAAVLTIDELGTIRFANQATERLFGYPLPAILGQSLTMLMPEPIRRASAMPWPATAPPAGVRRPGRASRSPGWTAAAERSCWKCPSGSS